MSLALLGEGFEVHGGGQDLRFPHHENERAQAVALGRTFARHWMHNGLVTVGGEKMSKSLGNFTTLSDLLLERDPRAYRMLVLQSGYRSPLEVTPDLLDDAGRAVARLDALARRIAGCPGAVALSGRSPVASAVRNGERPLAESFAAIMDDDLDTPGAVAALFLGLRRANSLLDSGAAAEGIELASTVVELFGVLGLRAAVTSPGADELVSAEVQDLVTRRDLARGKRDFAAADALRRAIEERGFTIEDAPGGTRLHRR